MPAIEARPSCFPRVLSRYDSAMFTLSSVTGSVGVDFSPLRPTAVGVFAIASTTSWPDVTRPKIV